MLYQMTRTFFVKRKARWSCCCTLQLAGAAAVTACLDMLHSSIHVGPVAEAHLSNASPFQTPLMLHPGHVAPGRLGPILGA
jgi:hypothetical protein